MTGQFLGSECVNYNDTVQVIKCCSNETMICIILSVMWFRLGISKDNMLCMYASSENRCRERISNNMPVNHVAVELA